MKQTNKKTDAGRRDAEDDEAAYRETRYSLEVMRSPVFVFVCLRVNKITRKVE